jgi:DNA-directed RNA polymerase specialized sigma24 family protein
LVRGNYSFFAPSDAFNALRIDFQDDLTNIPSPMKESCQSATTLWTQVIEVIQSGDSQSAELALAQFCEQYRPVILGFFCRRGWEHGQAEDLTHDFLAAKVFRRIEGRNGFLHRARRGESGSFRKFLSVVLWDFHYDSLKKLLAQKAGGRAVHVPVDELEFSRMGQQPPDEVCHETDRAIAVKVLEDAAGEATRSAVLLDYLRGKIESVKEGAARLEVSENAFKVAVHRLLERLKTNLRAEVSKLVGPSDQEVEEELTYLMSLLLRPNT